MDDPGSKIGNINQGHRHAAVGDEHLRAGGVGKPPWIVAAAAGGVAGAADEAGPDDAGGFWGKLLFARHLGGRKIAGRVGTLGGNQWGGFIPVGVGHVGVDAGGGHIYPLVGANMGYSVGGEVAAGGDINHRIPGDVGKRGVGVGLVTVERDEGTSLGWGVSAASRAGNVMATAYCGAGDGGAEPGGAAQNEDIHDVYHARCRPGPGRISWCAAVGSAAQ